MTKERGIPVESCRSQGSLARTAVYEVEYVWKTVLNGWRLQVILEMSGRQQ